MINLTEQSQQQWDWTVGELAKRKFENVSPGSPNFHVRFTSGLQTVDVIFSPGQNQWTANNTKGDSVTFRVGKSREDPTRYELYEVDKETGAELPCPKGNAVKIILAMTKPA
jgi:hypothetical protein